MRKPEIVAVSETVAVPMKNSPTADMIGWSAFASKRCAGKLHEFFSLYRNEQLYRRGEA